MVCLNIIAFQDNVVGFCQGQPHNQTNSGGFISKVVSQAKKYILKIDCKYKLSAFSRNLKTSSFSQNPDDHQINSVKRQ